MPDISANFLDHQGEPPRRRRYLLWGGLMISILLLATWTSAAIFVQPTDTPVLFNKPGFFRQLKNLILSSDRQLAGETDDRINILLLGMGGTGHDGAYLTDTIILTSIKPSTRQLALLSVPRDLLVKIPGFGFRRINEANALAELKKSGSGGQATKEVVGASLGLPIHFYIRIDFEGFKKMIDEMGGVDIYVDKTFTDTKFPAPNYKYQTVSFNEGWQKMNGQTALDFARSRHGNNNESNDFARARRQQKILAALKDKAFSFHTFFHWGRLQNMFSILQNHIQTDLELWEINRFYKLAKNLDYENMINRVLSANEKGPLVKTLFGGAAVLVPYNNDYEILKQLAQGLLSGGALMTTPKTATPRASSIPKIYIQNGTWILGLAALAKAKLEDQGWLIEAVSNASERNHEKTIVYDLSGGKFAPAVEKLKTDLTAEALNNPPTNLFTEDILPDILVIIGKDQAGLANQE